MGYILNHWPGIFLKMNMPSRKQCAVDVKKKNTAEGKGAGLRSVAPQRKDI